MIPEEEEAVITANALLDVAYADPDDNLRMLSRQLLRRHEELARLQARITELERERADCGQRWLNDASEKAEIIASLQAQLQAVTEERDALIAVFRDIEWCGLSNYCLLCGRTKTEGHNSVCRIAAALRTEVPKP